MKVLSILITIILLTLSQSSAQSIVGFWGVEEVLVGNRNVTPVAKWFKINKDGTQQSGNGWLQNATGSWSYNKENHAYLPVNSDGIADEFGAFIVNFVDDKMLWEREEEGMKVTVTLTEIKEMPMSPADKIRGLWDLSTVENGTEDITSSFDENDQHYMFIRWDRIYNMRNPEGKREFGFWHMDAHEPKFFLVNFNKEVAGQVYMVSFQENQLMMEQQDGEGLVLTYKRIDQIPK